MGSVTYKNQPAIDKTKGSVPLAGTSHIYRVQKKLWNDSIEDVLSLIQSGYIKEGHVKFPRCKTADFI